MTITVTHQVQASIGGQSTLAELSQLVDAAKQAGFQGNARVRIQHYAGDQREPSYTTITVSAR